MADPFIQVSSEFQPELTDIQRKQRLAQLLTERGMQAPQGQVVSGRYVAPNPLQYLSQLFNVYQGQNLEKTTEERQKALAEKLREAEMSDIQKFMEAGKPTPAQTTYGAGEEGPTMTVTPERKPDYAKQLAVALGSQSPTVRALGAEMLKQSMTPTKLGEGETLYTRDLLGGGGFAPVPGAVGNVKQTAEQKDYAAAVAGGFKGSFFDYQRALKQAGAQPINVSMGKDFAGQVGDIVRESAGMARAAQQTVQSADKIINAADKAITGKGAEVRLTATQLADTLGVGGKDKEKLEKTRELVQETAKLAINAANNKGQGAVSDYERSLYNRAAGGDINLTPTELKLIANRAKEGASYAIQSHQAKINAMKSNSETAQLVPYFDVTAPQQTPVAPTGGLPSQSAIDAEIARRQGRR